MKQKGQERVLCVVWGAVQGNQPEFWQSQSASSTFFFEQASMCDMPFMSGVPSFSQCPLQSHRCSYQPRGLVFLVLGPRAGGPGMWFELTPWGGSLSLCNIPPSGAGLDLIPSFPAPCGSCLQP